MHKTRKNDTNKLVGTRSELVDKRFQRAYLAKRKSFINQTSVDSLLQVNKCYEDAITSLNILEQ